MNTISRLISGSIAVFAGVVLIILPFFLSEKSVFFTWIYGIPILIIGIFILFNKREDQIEQIKSKKKLKISAHSNLKNSNERRFKK
ncbi:hypothetical protein KAT80_01180 [Candidatus Pacearchaeota archaeon]|nr:hypothetical protein [Candidatus Pacearchaeota archaeon]